MIPSDVMREASSNRLVLTSEETEEDRANVGVDVRPKNFRDYPGQDRVKENLAIYVDAAKLRGQALDHVVLHGPPGLGKTTLARIIASELGVGFYQTSGPSIDRPGDLAGLLAGMESRSVIFIDEIHRLNIAVEEILYSAMEDFAMDILVGQGPTARTVKMQLNPFTLIGATTRMSLLSAPLRSRFGIQERLEFYEVDALVAILHRSAVLWDMRLDGDGAFELARRSRGTPRIANRLLKRARDFGDYRRTKSITKEIVVEALGRLEIDEFGLDRMDRRILAALIDRYQGGPVGLDTLSATIGEERSTIEEVYEPFLVHQGFLIRGPRGREISEKGRGHLNETGFTR